MENIIGMWASLIIAINYNLHDDKPKNKIFAVLWLGLTVMFIIQAK